MISPGGDRLQALLDVIAFASSAKEPDEDRVWSRVLDKLAGALGCDAGAYFVFLPKASQLVARATLGAAGRKVESRRVELGQGLCGWAAKYREPVLVADAPKDERFLSEFDEASGYATKSVLAVPLLDRQELVGVIELVNKRGGPFDKSDLELVEAASAVASSALRSLRLESTVDKVTAHNASILDNLGGGFLAVDIHGRVMLCNPAARKILGLPEDQPANQPVDQVLSRVPELAELLMDTLVKKETVKRQDLWWKRQGQTCVLGYSTLLIQDPRGQVVGAGVTFQDITSFQKK